MALHAIERRKQKLSTPKLILLVVGIIFIAANLRAPITSVGPLIISIQESLAISNTTAGILTTVPLLAFAILSPFAPRFAERFGMELTLFSAMALLMAGLIVRPIGGVSLLLGGTILIGCAIAIGNVLMPAFVKLNFPNNIGFMTGMYSLSMNLSGAIAAGFSIPIAKASGFGWRGSLGFWALLTIAALLIWLPQIRQRMPMPDTRTSNSKPLWHSRLAWNVTIFMGLQSLLFYCAVAWLPVIFQSQGMNPEKSGWMLSMIQFSQLPFTFIVPILAGRMKNQLSLVIVTFILLAGGISGIIFGGNGMILLSVILFGVGTGFAFSLAMMFFSLRTQNSNDAARLSGMAQSVGYLLAASGPPLFGALYDFSGNWTVPLLLLIFVSICLLIVGIEASKEKFVA